MLQIRVMRRSSQWGLKICAGLVSRMRCCPGERLLCKTIDLRKACKNLPLSEHALLDSYICVRLPASGAPEAYQTLVLPFGARAAVMGFCRTSYAIWRIGDTIFHLHWAVYFDDFFLVAEVHEAGHVKMAQSLLFLLIGWETSSEKEAEFDAILRALGVQINLAEVSLGAITVCNVESRVKELVTSIDAILGKGVLSSADAKVLRGRMVFAEAQVFGRLAGFI